ncbi:MAG: hypothetical protein HQL93_10120, partial [Magnetococcales bacterium]|nr:hypothetical protein [Magnetococcales bacterium]
MDIKPIKSMQDYDNALVRIDSLMDAKLDTSEGDELDVLVILVEAFERHNFPIEAPDPIEVTVQTPR